MDIASELTQHMSHMLTLGYEAVVLPCSSMNCGDVLHRSTLDPVLRMEQRVASPQGIALLALATAYAFSQPGPLPGFWDTYILTPLQRAAATAYTKDDIVLGKKVATGGFGTVYQAELIDPKNGSSRPVILKKATEFGEAEVWMNERMMRAAPSACAAFITAFSESTGRSNDATVLVWAYEGDFTIADLMQKKDFPFNLEALLFDRPPNIPRGPERRAAVLRVAMGQLLRALRDCHAVGIVHRDVKPQNAIVSDATRSIKLIDLGAAADLRVGINYVPNQYLLDPRYAPPQQYIMSTQTPRAPPAPVAALLSPVLWQLNAPDRFDMFSVGVTLLQLAFPRLRNDNALVAFNKSMSEKHGWDLRSWRRSHENKGGATRPEWAEGFATLDADGGGGWDLVCQLVQYRPRDRPSAAAALAHPWFGASALNAVASTTASGLERTAERLSQVGGVNDADEGWLGTQMSKSGTKDAGGLTEAQLMEELRGEGGAPQAPRNASATIAWWQQRQQEQQAKASDRKPRAGEPKAAGGKAGRGR